MTKNTAKIHAIRRILGLLEKLTPDEQIEVLAMLNTLVKMESKGIASKSEGLILDTQPPVKKKRRTRKAKVKT